MEVVEDIMKGETGKMNIMRGFLISITTNERDYEKMNNVLKILEINCKKIESLIAGQIKKEEYKAIKSQLTGQIKQLEYIQTSVETYEVEKATIIKNQMIDNIKISIQKFNNFCEAAIYALKKQRMAA